jgi:hypothetical protein
MQQQPEPQPRFGQEAVREWRDAPLADAKREYGELINRLWLGNGADAAGMVSLMVQACHTGHLMPQWSLGSVLCFLLGFLALGAGSAARLWDLKSIVQDLEQAEGLMDVHSTSVRRPSHYVGLHLADPRTISGVAAAALFVLGLIFGGMTIYPMHPV